MFSTNPSSQHFDRNFRNSLNGYSMSTAVGKMLNTQHKSKAGIPKRRCSRLPNSTFKSMLVTNCSELEVSQQTHSLLFHPILFCRITNNLIYFFSSHAKRSSNFDNKNHFNKNDHMKLVKLLAAKRRCCKLQSVSP